MSTFGDAPDGQPTAHMLPRNLSYNFLVANYGGGNGAIDNDDESLRYENNHNFQVYGHQKFKTGAIRSYGNVIAYASEFGGKWKTPGTIADEPNAMFDNKVWFVDGANCESLLNTNTCCSMQTIKQHSRSFRARDLLISRYRRGGVKNFLDIISMMPECCYCNST